MDAALNDDAGVNHRLPSAAQSLLAIEQLGGGTNVSIEYILFVLVPLQMVVRVVLSTRVDTLVWPSIRGKPSQKL